MLQASNHSADKGISGVDSCISFWETHPEVLMTGMHEVENTEIPILEIEGFKFAVLNYTYSPNTESVSQKLSQRLNMLCKIDENTNMIDFTVLNPRVVEDIKKAEEIADVVIVCPHWGTEYQTKQSKYQEQFAIQMVEAGADLIIGTHPHVVQPVEIVKVENGNQALCYYSLGNYVSTQKNGQSMLEAMAWVSFHVSEEEVSVNTEESGVLPMVCHYEANPVRMKTVYLLEEYTEELASVHGIISYGGISFALSDLEKWSEEVLGEWVLEKKEALSCE